MQSARSGTREYNEGNRAPDLSLSVRRSWAWCAVATVVHPRRNAIAACSRLCSTSPSTKTWFRSLKLIPVMESLGLQLRLAIALSIVLIAACNHLTSITRMNHDACE